MINHDQDIRKISKFDSINKHSKFLQNWSVAICFFSSKYGGHAYSAVLNLCTPYYCSKKMKFLLFLWNTSIHYLLRLLVMSVFIHFQHFMEDSIASPIELQQVMYVLTNFVYIYEYKQTLWIPVLNCKINSAAVLSKPVPWDLFSFSYCIICKHIHALEHLQEFPKSHPNPLFLARWEKSLSNNS